MECIAEGAKGISVLKMWVQEGREDTQTRTKGSGMNVPRGTTDTTPITRELDFGPCGSIVIEGQRVYVEAFTQLASRQALSLKKAGARGHAIIRNFEKVLNDRQFRLRFPGVYMREVRVSCPGGITCIQ